MEIKQSILEEIKRNNNIITTNQIIKLGFSKTLLQNYVQEGLLERSRHGIYTLPNLVHDDMYTLMMRNKKIVFSHETALFLNGLADRTPFIHSVTISSNSALSSTLKEECTCYYIKSGLHQVGMVMKKTTMGNLVRCYNPERTICDLLRSRSRIDDETLISAIKNYAASPNKDLNLLAIYAKQFKVNKILRLYMGVLL